MNAFEKQVENVLPHWGKRGLSLWFLNPKMRPVGMRGKLPIFMQVAKAPFDMMGYDSQGIVIALELKSNETAKTRLPIIGEGKRGSGLQYHQLEALVKVYGSGGHAAVLWYNGGKVGMLDGYNLEVAWVGHKAGRTKSIPWSYFIVVRDLKGWFP